MDNIQEAQVVSQKDASADLSPELSESNKAKAEAKALLAEARNTREVLVAFASAIESGSYAGVKMTDIAKGMAFLNAILKQNKAHIHNLQERSE